MTIQHLCHRTESVPPLSPLSILLVPPVRHYCYYLPPWLGECSLSPPCLCQCDLAWCWEWITTSFVLFVSFIHIICIIYPDFLLFMCLSHTNVSIMHINNRYVYQRYQSLLCNIVIYFELSIMHQGCMFRTEQDMCHRRIWLYYTHMMHILNRQKYV